MYPTNITFHPELYKCIIISSDGIGSFGNMDGSIIEAEDIAKQLVAFKNIKGEFLQRRSLRMMKNLEQQNIFHTDDVSFGAIWLGDE